MPKTGLHIGQPANPGLQILPGVGHNLGIETGPTHDQKTNRPLRRAHPARKPRGGRQKIKLNHVHRLGLPVQGNIDARMKISHAHTQVAGQQVTRPQGHHPQGHPASHQGISHRPHRPVPAHSQHQVSPLSHRLLGGRKTCILR